MKLLVAVFALALLASASASGDQPTWKDCGNSSFAATVTGVTVEPYPIVAGKNVTMTATLDLSKAVTKPSYTIQGILYGAVMASHNGPACGQDYWTIQMDPAFKLTQTGLDCPASPGKVTITDELSTDTYIPISGALELKSFANEDSGAPVYCIDITVNL